VRFAADIQFCVINGDVYYWGFCLTVFGEHSSG
jgi:hypothetical protein